MSIFPEYADRKKHALAKHDGAEPRAGSPERDPSRSEAERGSNKNSKPHRFDKFALRIASGMITAIRVTLGVFSSPDKERWPFARLLDHLRGAETLTREMLREIAAEISITPAKLRERRNVDIVVPRPSPERAPCFRLGVNSHHDEMNEASSVPLSRFAGEGSGERAADSGARPLDPPPASGRGRRGSDAESLFQRRIAALEDVLAHPGKHGARMARALYRAEHETGGRLITKSPDDRLIDNINDAIAAFERGDDDNVARLHAQGD